MNPKYIYIYIYTSSFGPVYMRIVENYELLLENCLIYVYFRNKKYSFYLI